MSVATAAVSLLLAALLVFTALRKLSHRPEVVATYTRVGVPEERLNLLAALLLAGAAALVAGLWWRPVGIASAAALVAYFVLAIGAHVRARDAANAYMPAVYLLLVLVTLVLFTV
ncbi:DoxX family protein [Phytohabitans sp. LJ34]|uniref:DoxX family protein n=1 Tax=Phytohabitans sp. LJ34 TaxID=3452217 RepID=UPI003F89955A